MVRIARRLGEAFGLFWFFILRIRRNVVFQNLELAFGPNVQTHERLKIAKQSFVNFGIQFFEMLTLPFLSSSAILERVQASSKDWERVQKLQATKTGVLVLTAHLGNWEMMTRFWSLQGIRLSIVTKNFKILLLNKFWFWLRRFPNVRYIDVEGTAHEVLQDLKAGRYVAFMLDQHMQPPVGVESIFFGHRVGTIRSLAVLSLRTGIPVFPVAIVGDLKGQYHCLTEDPIDPKVGHPTVTELTQKYTAVIEAWVRRYPTEWNWLHRRFKLSHDYLGSRQ